MTIAVLLKIRTSWLLKVIASRLEDSTCVKLDFPIQVTGNADMDELALLLGI